MTMIRKVTVAKAAGDHLEYVLSDDTKDRMGDVISPKGWRLENFKKHPVALFNHNKDFVIGKWTNVRVSGDRLLGKLSLAKEGTSDRVDEIIRLVDQNLLPAVSVGFQPIEVEPLKDKSGGYFYKEQELLETSLVSVPANPNALAIAKSLNISEDVRKLVFAEQGNKREKREPYRMDDFVELKSLDDWTPEQARRAKVWLAGWTKDYPFNPLYRKMHRLMDEIETVRTISIVSAEHGNKGRVA